MNYKEEYEKALERAKSLHEQGMMVERVEYIFPELAESEDKKIRKELLEYQVKQLVELLKQEGLI